MLSDLISKKKQTVNDQSQAVVGPSVTHKATSRQESDPPKANKKRKLEFRTSEATEATDFDVSCLIETDESDSSDSEPTDRVYDNEEVLKLRDENGDEEMVRLLDDLLETEVLASPVSDSLEKVVNERLRRQEILKIIIALCRYIIPVYGLLSFLVSGCVISRPR